MSRLVVWDIESSSIDSAFSSMLQVAAICVDIETFEEIDRFDLRGRMKKEYPCPHPKALLINHVSVDQLKNNENSNFSLVSQVQNKFLSWGECLYMGWNSSLFDTKHIQQSFYQNCLPPYLTNTNGNRQGDALKVTHSSAALFPNSFVRPLSEKTGKITFQLEKFASANNIGQIKWHDALGDVTATFEVCKMLKERCPDVWDSALITSSKKGVYNLMDQDKIFTASRFFRGKSYNAGLVYLTKNPTYENHIYCFDIKHDPELIFDLDRNELKKLFKGKNKAFHIVPANQHPILLDEEYLYQTEEYRDENPEELRSRMKKIRSNKNFIEKFTNLLIDMNEEKQLSQDQSEKFLENQIYDGFASSKDTYLMNDFHAAETEKKYDIANKISDVRYKEFAKRVLYNEFPDALPQNELLSRDKVVAENNLSMENKPWVTIPQAMQAIDDLREDETSDLNKLEEIDEYIQKMAENFENILRK